MNHGVLNATRSAAVALCLAGALAACGAHSDDHRGPTKPPLEKMDLIVTKEPTTEMSRIGEPVRVPELDSVGQLLGPDQQRPLGDSARQVHPDTAKAAGSQG